jgi:hypothetical protein
MSNRAPGDVGQKPLNEQQDAAEHREKPRNGRIEHARARGGAKLGPRLAPGAANHGRAGERSRQQDAQSREHPDPGRNG